MLIRHLLSLAALACAGLFLADPPPLAAATKPATIVFPPDASYLERLAAREVRRYVYLRTGLLLPVTSNLKAAHKTDVILIARKDRNLVKDALAGDPALTASLDTLAPQTYWLKTLPPPQAPGSQRGTPRSGSRLLLLTGGDDVGTLYAAYRFAEALGVRFYLHGDVVPDEPLSWTMPALDEHAAPLFPLRGIQPFHDFPEGPDWWNRDEYLAIIAQLPKLRMNFIGLHTYPENHPCAEPTVWIGLPQDAGPPVKFSYPSSYMNTLRGNWGYAAKRTSDYIFGSAQLFERDDYGPQVMFGAMPVPDTPGLCNQVFDRTAAMLHDAFTFAHLLGVKTCVGTETPLTVPRLVRERLMAMNKDPKDPAVMQELYEGIFRRAAQAYPLDYYWFWTPEGWTWSGVKEEQIQATTNDLAAAIAAHRKVQPGFGLATCGWVLGPPQDRAMFDKVLPKDMAVSCINRKVGYTPVDAGFAQVHGRSKWAIPWLEDDGALAAPELWAGRMRRDAFDALRYGCDGLMGIHWRTRVLGPNIGALAQAAWDQSPWAKAYQSPSPASQQPRVPGPVGGAPPEAFPPIGDFYADWAAHEFGPEAGPAAAKIFQQVDCALPKPSVWVKGPGGIQPDQRPWDKVKDYAFVDEFAALSAKVTGAGNRERFNYWLNTFLYLRTMGEVNCAWGEYNAAIAKVKQEKAPEIQRALARRLALPARQKMVRLLRTLYDHLLAAVSTTGELGTVMNWNQHNLPDLLTAPGAELERILGEPLPADAQPDQVYRGPTRIIVPNLRGSLAANEPQQLKVLILSEHPPRKAVLRWRDLGRRRFATVPLTHVARGVYTVTLPAPKKDDFEYYIEVEPENAPPVFFPATAPKLNQTVVLCSEN